MPNLNIPLTTTGTDYITVLPDGTEYKTTASTPHMNSIGEKKRIKWKLSSTYSNLEGVNVYVQLGLFQQGIVNSPNPKVPINYQVTFPVGLAAGDYPMALMLPSGANANLNFNAEVTLRIVTSSTFHIIVDFFQIYDEMQYQNVSFQDNHNKLLLDQKQNTSELTIGTVRNCYNSISSQFAITMKLEKPGVIHAPDTYPYTDNTLTAFGTGSWLAGFYNRSALDSDPYFNTPIWEFKRNGVAVTNLSAAINTDVLFKITTPSGVSKVLFWIIRTDIFDNTVTMFDNYEANLEEINSSNTNIGLDKLTTPVINVTSIGAGVYKVGCSLAADKLTNNAKYRMIAIVYYKDGSDFYVNSFISDELICDSSPCFDGEGFDAIGSLDDYNKQYEGNDLECVIEERMRSKIFLSFPFDKWKNDLYNRLGITGSNDIRRYLTKIKIDFYDENAVIGLGVVRNLYDTKTVIKTGINTYTTQPGMTLNFGSTWAEFIYEWRNRFENGVDCIETSIDNSYTVTPVYAQQYWGGKTIKIRWTLTFFYDDYSAPFTDIVEFYQQIRVKDYTGLTVRHWADSGTRSKFDDVVNYCQGEVPCFAAYINGALTDRKLITNIVPIGAGINAISEAEAWVGNQLEQLTTDKITDQDEDFATSGGSKIANFCIDTSKLLIYSYQISAISKKEVDTGLRVTEKENPSVFEQRITEENNNRRITDNL